MKKLFVTLALVCATALSTTAQTVVNFGQFFGVPASSEALNAPIAKGADGVALIGDYRSNVEEGHAAGLTYTKRARYFKVNGTTVKTDAAVNLMKYPTGVQKNFEVLPSKMPVNRCIQMKAATDGKVQACAWSKKGAGRLFMGVFRGGKWQYQGEAAWDKGNASGTEASPYQPVAFDYAVQAGDVVAIFAGSAMEVSALYYTGQLDQQFKGDDPRNLASKKKKSSKK